MNLYRKRVSFLSLLVISSLSLTACESLSKIHLGPKLGIKIPIKEDRMELEDTSKEGTEQGNAAQKPADVTVTGYKEPSDQGVFLQLDNDEKIGLSLNEGISGEMQSIAKIIEEEANEILHQIETLSIEEISKQELIFFY